MNLKKTIIIIFSITIFLNLICCSLVKPIKNNKNINKNKLNKLIEEHIEPPIPSSFGGKIFYNCKVISAEKNKNIIKVYLWLLAQEYYLKETDLQKGTGGIFSVAITMELENDYYKFIKYNISIPEGQNDFLIFPKSIRKKAKLDIANLNKSFSNEIEEKAKLYYFGKQPGKIN